MPSTQPSPPPFPLLRIPPHPQSLIRSLLLISTHAHEHLANLHLPPITRTQPPTQQIPTLTTPQSPPPQTPTRLVPLLPTIPPTPPPTPPFSLPLFATATLSHSSLTIYLHLTTRLFFHSLSTPSPFPTADPSKLAQTALSILLSSGHSLRPNLTAGLLRRRHSSPNSCLEPYYAHEHNDNDHHADDAGIWLLTSGSNWDQWHALACFADRLARRRNRRLLRDKKSLHSNWAVSDFVILYFDDQGRGAQIRRASMKVCCGKQGVVKYRAEIGGGGEGRDAVGRFVREQGPDVVPNPVERPRVGHQQVEGWTASRRQIRRRVRQSRERNTDGHAVDSHVDNALHDDVRKASSHDSGSFSNLAAEVDQSDSSGDDDTMNDLCLKYLDSSYADEIQRRRDPPTPDLDT